MSEFAELNVDGKVYNLPIIEGTEKEKGFDISKLRSESGLITVDTGYKNTGATKSSVTFLDGEKGILRYRGYPIEELAEKSTFLEVAYLLIYGNLPSGQELYDFKASIKSHQLVHEDMKKILEGFPSTAHPMGVLSSMATSLTAFFPESLDPNRSADLINLTIIWLLAKITTLVSWSYTNARGIRANYPDNNLDYVGNFMKMMFKLPNDGF